VQIFTRLTNNTEPDAPL